MFRAIMVAVVILHLAGCNSTDAPGNPTPGKGEDCVGECKGPHGTKDSVDELPGTGESCTRGLPCDDDDPCTSDDVCVDGKCAGQPYVCDDELDCTKDACDGTGKCQHEPKSGWCLIDGACHQQGEQEPGNSCRECLSSVDRNAWSNDDSNQCSDSDVCTLEESCVAGECVSTPARLECNDDNPCTTDICLPQSGCNFVNNQDPCDDGSLCTGNDTCTEGACLGKPNATTATPAPKMPAPRTRAVPTPKSAEAAMTAMFAPSTMPARTGRVFREPPCSIAMMATRVPRIVASP